MLRDGLHKIGCRGGTLIVEISGWAHAWDVLSLSASEASQVQSHEKVLGDACNAYRYCTHTHAYMHSDDDALTCAYVHMHHDTHDACFRERNLASTQMYASRMLLVMYFIHCAVVCFR